MSDSDRPRSPTEWQRKLVGKKIADSDAVSASGSDLVKRSELPQNHRVVKPGMMVTKDYVEDRLNVYVDGQGTCTSCYFG